MADKMTLQQVLDTMRQEQKTADCEDAHAFWRDMADALDTHLAGMGEQVGVTYTMEALVPGGEVRCYAALNQELPAGTKLFAAPPASGDWDAVRRARDALRAGFWDSAGMANRLTAALPENAK